MIDVYQSVELRRKVKYPVFTDGYDVKWRPRISVGRSGWTRERSDWNYMKNLNDIMESKRGGGRGCKSDSITTLLTPMKTGQFETILSVSETEKGISVRQVYFSKWYMVESIRLLKSLLTFPFVTKSGTEICFKFCLINILNDKL